MEKRSFPAVLDSLAAMRGYARDAALAAGIAEDRAYGLQLAVDEIATNIINYGYRGAAGARIAMGSEVANDALVVTLEDEAPAFDPRALRLPDAADLARPLEERPIGGLGVYLALQGVDRFDYRREGGTNVSVFELKLRKDG